MGIEPLYPGSDSFECCPDLDVHPFFLTNNVSSWTVEVFLGQHPSDVELYSTGLSPLNRTEGLPGRYEFLLQEAEVLGVGRGFNIRGWYSGSISNISKHDSHQRELPG